MPSLLERKVSFVKVNSFFYQDKMPNLSKQKAFLSEQSNLFCALFVGANKTYTVPKFVGAKNIILFVNAHTGTDWLLKLYRRNLIHIPVPLANNFWYFIE